MHKKIVDIFECKLFRDGNPLTVAALGDALASGSAAYVGHALGVMRALGVTLTAQIKPAA